MSDLFEAFKRIAVKQESAPCLTGTDGTHTYGSALERIAFLAQEIALPVRAAVVIVGAKQCDTVLWQLACNKAGQVFVPCDAATPPARLAEILARIRPQTVLADADKDLSAQGYFREEEVGLMTRWSSPQYSQYEKEVSHIIFSSGSTGKPKAILLPDTPVVEVVTAQADLLGMDCQAKVAWLLSPAFDASLSDIYATLLTGGHLHVCAFSMRNLKTLQAYFQEHRITHTDLSPSVLPLLSPEGLPELCGIIFGGELAKESVIFEWIAKGKRLFNAYGPTETTICTSLREAGRGWTATNIGQPLPGVSYWLREADKFTSAVPGMRGELYVSGTHLAVGYDNSELTAQRFIEQDQRYYKTGDVVEIDEQGDAHFRGRVDRQMKFHGVLLCPEEIEAQALRAGCTEALLRLEDKKLTLHYAGDVDEATLKLSLKDNLLPLALPHRYSKWKALPKSIAGKIQL